MQALMELKHIYKTYHPGDNPVEALIDVNLQIEAGEFIAIKGTSGSGKSTLMNILGCLDLPTSGQYFLKEQDVAHRNDHQLSVIRNQSLGFVFQGFHLISSLSAIENVELPLAYRNLSRTVRRQLATEALEKVGLGNRLKHLPNQMSGGQQQRVAIARAIAASPPIILADEPTGNLDSHAGEEVMQLLFDLNREGHTILLITHDQKLAQKVPRIVSIQDGRIVC